MDKPEHQSIVRWKYRGVEKGSGRRSNLPGRERSLFYKKGISTVQRAPLGVLMRDGTEHV